MHTARRHGFAACEQLVPGECAGERATAERDDGLELWKDVAAKVGLLAGRELRADFVQHREIIGRFECVDKSKPTYVRLAECILQFAGAIGRVDVHEHNADTSRGEL